MRNKEVIVFSIMFMLLITPISYADNFLTGSSIFDKLGDFFGGILKFFKKETVSLDLDTECGGRGGFCRQSCGARERRVDYSCFGYYPGRGGVGNAIVDITGSANEGGGGDDGEGGGYICCMPSPEPVCNDRDDNDNDGYIDMQDPGCNDINDESENDCNTGNVQTSDCPTNLQGVCSTGTKSRDCVNYNWGQWSQCIPSIQPGQRNEFPGNNADDDCDGSIDEVQCRSGNRIYNQGEREEIVCYAGIGECRNQGINSRTCLEDGMWDRYSGCNAIAGQPSEEMLSNSLDDDCDGDIDERSDTYILIVDSNPAGSGTFTRNPGIEKYEAGTQVTVTPTANADYTFRDWTETVEGRSNGNSLIFTMPSRNVTITANFVVDRNRYCGDGTKNLREECDGDDFGGETCLTLGFDGGNLGCYPIDINKRCTFDTFNCYYDEEGDDNREIKPPAPTNLQYRITDDRKIILTWDNVLGNPRNEPIGAVITGYAVSENNFFIKILESIKKIFNKDAIGSLEKNYIIYRLKRINQRNEVEQIYEINENECSEQLCTYEFNAPVNGDKYFIKSKSNDIESLPSNIVGPISLLDNPPGDSEVVTPLGYSISITINPQNSGEIRKTPNRQRYNAGEDILLKAIPHDEGYRFIRWQGDIVGQVMSGDEIRIRNIQRDKNIIANFELIKYTLSLNINNQEGGRVSIDIPQPEGGYLRDTQIKLTAIPSQYYKFIKYIINNGTFIYNISNATINITIKSNIIITSVFERITENEGNGCNDQVDNDNDGLSDNLDLDCSSQPG